MIKLHNSQLWQTQIFINGLWCDAEAKKTFAVVNPATGDIVAQVADGGREEATRAIAAASDAQQQWQTKTAQERSHILRKWFDLVMLHQEDLAQILTLEQGKPLPEARAEIAYGASYIEWFAEEAKRIQGDVIAPPSHDKRIVTLKQPIGVVAAITPWNFPNAMLARKIAPALAAGCTIVVKPAAETPLSALALVYLADQAGVPAGVINLVCGTDAAAIGDVFTHHPQVRKLTFTGSTAVGKKLIAQCASGVKKISLELGGNAPFIVFDDADLDAAVEGAIAAKFRNAGQTCVCVNRFYIQRTMYDAFSEKFIAAASQLTLGDGFQPATTVGPLISAKAIHKVNALVDDAIDKGATLAYQSELPSTFSNNSFFYPIKVLTQVNPDSLLTREEIFGPVAALIPFDTEQEVIELANNTEFGLSAYCYTRNANRMWRIPELLEVGMVGMNTGLISNAMAPFGGVKQSGWGREGSRYGIDDYLVLKYICQDLN